MSSHRAYYSVIQYCPDLGRMEAANIGVVLFCPELHFLESRITRANDRIIHFFGREGHDWKQINAFKSGIADRIRNASDEIRNKESFSHFIRLQANFMQLTEPMPCKVSDRPAADLNGFFESLVGIEKPKSATKAGLRRTLEKRFEKAGVSDRVHLDLKVRVPVLERQVDVPFGFQNGRYNLITPVKFEAKSNVTIESTACRYAVEGRSIFEHPSDELGPMKLIVVGKFRPSDNEVRSKVNRILTDNQVRLVRIEQMAELIDEIRLTAKPIQQ